jgi:hypothetical protein
MFKVIEHILSADLAASGTVDINYPSGTQKGTFLFGVDHKIRAGNTALVAPDDFTVTLNAASFRITLGSGESTIPSGTKLLVQLDAGGDKDTDRIKSLRGVSARDSVELLEVVQIDLGTPATLDADGICASQDPAGAGELTINGALASDGVATLDVPRNVTITSAGDDTGRVFTITGTDEYGEVVVENITGANAGAAAGKKAFKTVTSVEVDGNSSAVTVGTGDVLGLPVGLVKTGQVLKELQDGAAATAGTVVAAVQSAATATTGDVRGTYDPNSACNGALSFTLIVALRDPTWKGVTQYGG